MLRKLLKYETKATARVFLPLFLALFIFAVITRFTSSAMTSGMWKIPMVISMMLYGFIIAGIFAMVLLTMIQRFYKSMLSDEGYLTLTLPVKSWQHILNKLLVTMFWVLISGLAAFISVLIVAMKTKDIAEILKQAGPLFQQLAQLNAGSYVLGFEVIIGLLISLASGILLVYASIALGHLFNRHKLLASFGAFLVLTTLTQIFFTIISLIARSSFSHNMMITLHNFAGKLQEAQLVFLAGIIIMGLISGAYFTITNYILSRRLNLE